MPAANYDYVFTMQLLGAHADAGWRYGRVLQVLDSVRGRLSALSRAVPSRVLVR